MNWLLALLIRPFVAVLFIFVAFAISRLIWRWMPDSKLKRILFSPLPGYKPRKM
jgi:hypothetical protein